MKTISFIGSDKNAGKTTAMNFTLLKHKGLYCVSSIGLNGEALDNLNGNSKPSIEITKGNYFLTASEHLKNLNGLYLIRKMFTPPFFFKNYVLAQALCDLTLIIEGPNEKTSWINAKFEIEKIIPNGALFIDGSIDRQFIAHPQISDVFSFCLLSSDRLDQKQKAINLLAPLQFDNCSKKMAKTLKNLEAKSIVLNQKLEPIYLGNIAPFMDDNLLQILRETDRPILYLEGALTSSLQRKLESLGVAQVIINNFTLYQNSDSSTALLPIALLHPIKLNRIFIKEEASLNLNLPDNVPITNLFREIPHDIAV